MYYATTFNQAGQEGQTPNSTYPKGGVSCSKDSFVVNGTLVFQIKLVEKGVHYFDFSCQKCDTCSTVQ